MKLSAQEEIQDSSILLNIIEIAEPRFVTPLQQMSRSTQLMPGALVRELPVRSIHEALGFQAGIDVRQRGINGVQADIGIRGSGFDQSLVLLNGVKLSDPQTGHHMMNIPLHPMGLDRIEIFKSSGSRHYGVNAFAGVIHLISEPAMKQQVKGEVYYADFNSLGSDWVADFQTGKILHRVQASYHQSDGYRYNTDYIMGSGYYLGKSAVGKGTLHWQLAYTDRAFGANGFYASEQFTEQWERTRMGLGSIQYKQQTGAWQQSYLVYHRTHHDRYLFIRDNPSFFENIHQTNVSGAEMHIKHRGVWAESALGVELRREFIESTNLGTHERYIAGVFLEQKYQWGLWGLSPGVYWNYFSDASFQWYPGLELNYRWKEHTHFFANTSRSFRLPTYTDLFYVGPNNIGNAALLPETAWNAELGIRTNMEAWNWELSLWTRRTQNLIDWIRMNTEDTWQPVNFFQVHMQGIEWQQQYRPQPGSSMARYLKYWNLGYTYIHAIFEEDEKVISRYALSNLRHQISQQLMWQYHPSLQQLISVRYANRVSLEDYWVLDSRINYRFPLGNVYLEINNLFNAVYRETDLVPMPGRWWRLGWQFEW